MSKKLPKNGPPLTARIKAILKRHDCPGDIIDDLAIELREMACGWRDESGSNGRRQGTPLHGSVRRSSAPTARCRGEAWPRMPDEYR